MSRVIQLELTLNIEVEAHYSIPKDRMLHQGDWVLDEIVSMHVIESRDNTYDLATSSILATYLQDERKNEILNLFAQQEP